MQFVALAKSHNVISFSDVLYIIARLAEMTWAFGALDLWKKKPTFARLRKLLKRGEQLKFINDDAMMQSRAIFVRAVDLQNRFKAVLKAIPKSEMPAKINIAELTRLSINVFHVPVRLPEAAYAQQCIEDGGNRYCKCGGASDGRFMLCCEKCDEWCHGDCFNVSEAVAQKMNSWVCGTCCQERNVPYPNFNELNKKGENITAAAHVIVQRVLNPKDYDSEEKVKSSVSPRRGVVLQMFSNSLLPVADPRVDKGRGRRLAPKGMEQAR